MCVRTISAGTIRARTICVRTIRAGTKWVCGPAHHHRIRGQDDLFCGGADAEVFHVECDAQILAHHHAGGENLYFATAIGQNLGNRCGLVEAQLVDDHYLGPSRWSGLAGEDGHHVNNVARVAGRPVWSGRNRAGCDDYRIGLVGADEVRINLVAVHNFDVGPGCFVELVTNKVTKLGTIGNRCRPANLTASNEFTFVNRDLVSMRCGGNGGLQTSRASTDNHDSLAWSRLCHEDHFVRRFALVSKSS